MSTGVSDLHAFRVTMSTQDKATRTGGMLTVEAAYLSESGSYTYFKDETHAVVCALKTDHVLEIVRLKP